MIRLEMTDESGRSEPVVACQEAMSRNAAAPSRARTRDSARARARSLPLVGIGW